MSINDKLFQQMFMQFLQTQASIPASQVPVIKSECIPDPKVYTGEGSFIKQIYEYLKTLELVLTLSGPSSWTACQNLKQALPTVSHAPLEQLKVTLHSKSRPSIIRIRRMFFKTSKTFFQTLIWSFMFNASL